MHTYTDTQLEKLWKEFGAVPILYSSEHPDGVLESDWHVFKAGTERMDVWHWFDERYSKGLHFLIFTE